MQEQSLFQKIRGQSRALKILFQAIENEHIAHAYLFHGIEGVGKFTTALYFGMALNCLANKEFRPCGVCSSCHKFLHFEHPDLIYLFPTPNLQLTPDGEIKNDEYRKEYEGYLRNKIETPWEDYRFSSNIMIRKESISWLIKRLNISSYEAKYRICIIEDADLMNIETANAFLKTLEEPPESTVIILTTNNPSQLLPTIVSRCQPIHFQPVDPNVIAQILIDDFNTSPRTARIVSQIADGSVKYAIHLVQGESSKLRERAFEIMQMALEGNDLAYYRSLQANLQKYNAENLIEIIRYLCMFVGDLDLIESAEEQVVNIDKKDFLIEARAKIPIQNSAELTDKVLDFVLLMQDYIRKIRGNVNLQLIQQNLYFQLNNLFRP